MKNRLSKVTEKPFTYYRDQMVVFYEERISRNKKTIKDLTLVNSDSPYLKDLEGVINSCMGCLSELATISSMEQYTEWRKPKRVTIS